MKTTQRVLQTVVTAGAVFLAGPASLEAGPLNRLASNYDCEECLTSTDASDGLAGGVSIYTQSVNVPRGHDVLFVSFDATGDNHGGATSCFAAILDGKTFFNPPASLGGAATSCAAPPISDTIFATGWVPLLKPVVPIAGSTNCGEGGGGAGDCHDNNINYTWCLNIGKKPGLHTVNVRMASSGPAGGAPDGTVFIEKAHFSVESSALPSGKSCRRTISTLPDATIGPTEGPGH